MSKAVVLLSGGLDSTTCLSIAIKEGYDVYTLSFDYGQKNNKEISCTQRNSKVLLHKGAQNNKGWKCGRKCTDK